jgi:hypothetical protein
MPCIQAGAAREGALYIQQHRRDLNEFEGITDPVEALKIIHRPRQFDRLVNWIPYPIRSDQLYAELSVEQAQSLAGYAEALMATDRHDEARSIME